MKLTSVPNSAQLAWVTIVPWWGWVGLVILAAWLRGHFSSIRRLNRVANVGDRLPPSVRELKRLYGIEPLMEIAQISGKNAYSVFQNGLPSVASQIRNADDLRDCGRALSRLAESSGDQAVFRSALRVLTDAVGVVNLKAITALTELVRLCRHEVLTVLELGIPHIRTAIHGSEDLSNRVLLIESLRIARARLKPPRDEWVDLSESGHMAVDTCPGT